MKKDFIYALTALGFSIMIGGAVYEHLGVVPQWAAAPPVSLSMFQGEYGIRPEVFWMLIHPVNIVLFSLTLILHWKTARRTIVLSVFALYVAVLLITGLYFVPELLSIIKTPMSSAADPDLVRRAGLWETLSLVRLACLLVMGVVLFMGLAKPAHPLPAGNKSSKKRKIAGEEKAVAFTALSIAIKKGGYA
jgi:hypothetical protein